MSNGLAFPHDGICYFQSQYAHRASTGYFAHNSISLETILKLLCGYEITIIDATRRHKLLTDALKFGVPTFCLVFNRAIKQREIKVCSWETREMRRIAFSKIHKSLVQTIRKLANIYGYVSPLIIGDNIMLECHQGFIADDNPKRLQKLIAERRLTHGNDPPRFVNAQGRRLRPGDPGTYRGVQERHSLPL